MTKKEAEQSAAREFLLARLAICRGALASAAASLDEALALFVDTDDDAKGKTRADLLEAVDAALGEAARAIQLGMPALADIDPEEGEPDEEDEDDDEEDDEDEDDEE
jgi:hypothetical protein